MKVDKEQIKHIAKLAKIELTPVELAQYETEFNNILEYVSAIDDCDVSEIEDEHNLKNYVGEKLYEDTILQSQISREAILKNATTNRSKAGYIKVSKNNNIVD